MPTVEIERIDRMIVAKVAVDRMSLESADELRVELEQLLSDMPLLLLLDMGRVRFISSEAINGLFVVQSRLSGQGGQLKLCSLNEPVENVFHMLKLDKTIFSIYADRAEAEAAFRDG